MPEEYLEHHGILGQKWGVRRYQNSDGSLTAEGKKRYTNDANKVKNRQANSNHWEEKANERAHEYNRSSMKLKIARYPFEKPINKMRYDWNKFGYDRAYNRAYRATKRYVKRYGERGLNTLTSKQIKDGKAFMYKVQSNQMVQATMNSRFDKLQSQMYDHH